MERFPVVMATRRLWQCQPYPRSDQQTLVSRHDIIEQVGVLRLTFIQYHDINTHGIYYNKSSAVAEMFGHLPTIDMARKIWRLGLLCPFSWEGGAGILSNTMSPGPRPTSTPSGILIHPTVGHNTPTLQTEQTGEWSRSEGRTVACNGRPKTAIIDARLAPIRPNGK